MHNHTFNVSKKIDPTQNLNLYDVKYFELKLQALETLDEGEITLANRIHILRKYVAPKTQTDSSLYEHTTKIHDITIEQKRGSIALIHGMNQSCDVFMEMALTLAMNGYFVHMIDLEGAGYSAGSRIGNLTVEKFHH